jgi:hypothetical protein
MQIGLLMVRDRFPGLAHFLDRVSDLNPRRLGVTPSRIYAMLLHTPVEATRKSAPRQLSRPNRDRLEKLIETHDPEEGFLVRDALLFAVAECMRSEAFADCLARGDMETVGRLMRRSHDAERALPRPTPDAVAGMLPCTTDARLRELIADLASEDPERVAKAQIENQPGRYGSSTPRIDALVDAALAAPGVVGAQLSGSGMGGCVMVLVRDHGLGTLAAALRRAAPAAVTQPLAPAAGSGALAT